MHVQQRQVKDSIMREYPGVWNVGFSVEDDVFIIRISALPSASLCLITLSRLIAAEYIPSYYTIDVQFEWKPGRLDLLFGPPLKSAT